ncbi:MAG: hypothetical protein KF763_13105 [Cyclobacteriaceae bacterium]|nr:hypothetical protein [Cyclobacteriaceae bacterium]
MDTELTSNETVAKTVLEKLKESKLILNDESVAEKKIANGTIKENDWKVLFESKLKEVIQDEPPSEAK